VKRCEKIIPLRAYVLTYFPGEILTRKTP